MLENNPHYFASLACSLVAGMFAAANNFVGMAVAIVFSAVFLYNHFKEVK